MAKVVRESFEGMSGLPLAPLNADYTINKKAIGEIVDMMAGYKMKSLWIRGFCAECMKLTMEGSKTLLDAFYEAGKGKTILGAGVSAQKPDECVELANYAEKIGYDFAWVTPSTLATSADEILLQFKILIKNTSLPLAIYNSSGTGVYLSPLLMRDIIDLAPDRFVAIKDSQGATAHVTEVFRLGIDKRVAFMTTVDSSLYTLYLGTKCLIGTPEHIVLGQALYEAFMAGDYEKANFLQFRLNGGFPMMGMGSAAINTKGVNTMPIHMLDQKYAISIITGIGHGPYMPPTLPASPEVQELIKKYIEWWKPFDVDAPLPGKEYGDMVGMR